jgi:DNA-binding transcriptional LysR family regulator
LLGRLRPALGDVASVLDHIAERRERPAGRVRLVVSPLAAAMVLAPKLSAFAHAYPDVVLDVTTTNEMRLDLVGGHFDAGIHLGEFIERDMIAVRVSADQRAAIVGAPAYFDAHQKPKSPRDLRSSCSLQTVRIPFAGSAARFFSSAPTRARTAASVGSFKITNADPRRCRSTRST